MQASAARAVTGYRREPASSRSRTIGDVTKADIRSAVNVDLDIGDRRTGTRFVTEMFSRRFSPGSGKPSLSPGASLTVNGSVTWTFGKSNASTTVLPLVRGTKAHTAAAEAFANICSIRAGIGSGKSRR